MRNKSSKKNFLLPGFRLTLGYTLLYLSFIVLLPLVALGIKATGIAPAQFIRLITSPRALSSFRVTILTALISAGINAVFGFLIAWVLTRYRFIGRRILDAFIDLPFALPTAVAGIALTVLYAPNGWFGYWLNKIGIKVAFTPIGITIALIFVGFPFVIRTMQPVLEDLSPQLEEAAASLGAKNRQIFFRVLLPELFPALFTGFTLAFARALGEYGSVIFIAGNLPMKTEITSLLIITQLEQYNYVSATAIAAVMLVFSFLLLLLINVLQRKIEVK